jgi:chitin synthase
VNFFFKWIYLSLLGLQFVLALGNRPKGERFAYVTTLWYVIGFSILMSSHIQRRIYAFLSVYLFACSIILTVKSFSVGPVTNFNWLP